MASPCRLGCALLGPAASGQLSVPLAASSAAARDQLSGAEELAGKLGGNA